MSREQKANIMTHVPLGPSILWWSGLLLYYCWFQAFYNALKFDDIFPYESLSDFGFGVVCNIVPIATIWWMYIAIVFKWISFRDRLVKIAADILAAMLTAICVNWLFAMVFTLLTGWDASIDWSGTLLNDLLVLLLIEMTFYFKSLIRYQGEVEDMHRQVMHYKYNTLKAQVNPHFLFNSFNLLYSLVSIDPSGARIFIQNLAEMYRYVLDRHERDRVPASEEIDFIRAYIGVLTTRYNNKFFVTWSGIAHDSDFLSRVTLIPFSLQILLENVVKHNVVSSRSPMSVEIKLDEEGITVVNPIHPRQTSPKNSSGFGLKYLKSVYESMGCQLRVSDSTSDGMFEVYLQWLPQAVETEPQYGHK